MTIVLRGMRLLMRFREVDFQVRKDCMGSSRTPWGPPGPVRSWPRLCRGPTQMQSEEINIVGSGAPPTRPNPHRRLGGYYGKFKVWSAYSDASAWASSKRFSKSVMLRFARLSAMRCKTKNTHGNRKSNDENLKVCRRRLGPLLPPTVLYVSN